VYSFSDQGGDDEQIAGGMGWGGTWALAAGERQEAIRCVLSRLNAETNKSVPLQLQFAYYLFLSGDPASAAQVLTLAYRSAPDNTEVLRNLCVCLSRSDQHERAVTHLVELVRREPDDYLVHDGLCTSLPS
jgi:Flp pilus assembly protein TadD